MTKVVSMGSSKEAALYFDEVFPDDLASLGIAKVRGLSGAESLVTPLLDAESANKVIQSLLPNQKDAVELVRRFNLVFAFMFFKAGIETGLSDEKRERLLFGMDKINRELDLGLDMKTIMSDEKAAASLPSEALKILRAAGFSSSDVWTNEEIWTQENIVERNMTDGFAITLRDMNLVDASKLTWDHVVDFRKDKKSMKALRNLRVFFAENFDAKPSEYVIDKLLQLEDEYRSTIKLWGFETAQKSLSAAFDSGSAMMASAATLATAVTGAPLVATAVAGAAIPFGKAALEFSRVAIESSKSRASNPTEYLSHLRKLKR